MRSSFLVTLIFARLAWGMDWQAPESMRKVVEEFVKTETADISGDASVTIGNIDSRLRLTRCDRLQPFLPAGTKLWGNATVGVRCESPESWTVYIPVSVKIKSYVVVTTKPLVRGHTIIGDDIAVRQQDITQLPSGVITDPKRVVGSVISTSIPAGFALRADMLRARTVIKQGQQVHINYYGKDFKVSAEGKALSDAGIGQVVQVRTSNGQTVQGIARDDGSVEAK